MTTLFEPVAANAPAKAGPLPGSYSILCADDEPNFRLTYQRVLERSGYAVDTVADGEQGWNAAHNGHYDLILTDHAMPRMNGLELARRLRQDGMSQPIIIATAHVKPLLDADLSRIRFAAILLKPFTLVDLLAAVGQALARIHHAAPGNRPAIAENRVFHLSARPPKRWGLNE